jgi:ribosomal protein S18 acetylase RimI-like enzyme
VGDTAVNVPTDQPAVTADAPVPLAASQWPLLKRLRLAALADSPDAFSPTLEETLAHPDAYWQTWAERAQEAGRRVFIANVNGDPAGLVSAVRDDDGVGHIGAMRVDPLARRAHLGRSLLRSGCDFLAAAGCGRIVLTVTETNAAAIAMYESEGFALTGRSQPLRPGSPLANLEMAREKPPA